MGDLATNLPMYYGLAGKAVKEKGRYICRTNTGYGKIFRTTESPRAIHKQYAMLEQLAANGFDQLDRIFLSAQGLPYISLGRETYVMTRHIPGRDIDLDNADDVKMVLQSLARFHKAARGLNFEPSLAPSPAPVLSDTWKKHLAELKQFLKQINRSPKLSDFDLLFIKNAPFYLSQAAAAIDALETTDYEQQQRHAISRGFICHNELKEENLSIMDETCHIARITDATFDLQLTDLAGFIRRYARRSQKEIPIHGLLEIYHDINPLDSAATTIVHAQLIYPVQFTKIIRQHYSKKRNWTPAAITSRINALLEQQADYDKYVNQLWDGEDG